MCFRVWYTYRCGHTATMINLCPGTRDRRRCPNRAAGPIESVNTELNERCFSCAEQARLLREDRLRRMGYRPVNYMGREVHMIFTPLTGEFAEGHPLGPLPVPGEDGRIDTRRLTSDHPYQTIRASIVGNDVRLPSNLSVVWEEPMGIRPLETSLLENCTRRRGRNQLTVATDGRITIRLG